MRWLQMTALVSMAACGSETPRSEPSPPGDSPTRTCGITQMTLLTGAGLAELHVGASVEQIRATCDVVRDSTIAHGNEGMPERKIAVALAGDTTEALVESDTVRRIEVTSARFRTSDSLGVGTTARALREMNATLAVGDRGVFALVPTRCGLSFHLAGVSPAQSAWSAIPDSTQVDRVLVIGC